MRSDLTSEVVFEAKIKVATFYANHWTKPSQNLLFSNWDGHTGLKAFLGCPKGVCPMPLPRKTVKLHLERNATLPDPGA